MKYTIQDEIGRHFMDKVIEGVKAGKTFSFLLDNIDWDVKVHEMRSDNQNKSVHAVATSTSHPDQPLSHVHPAIDPNDPLVKIKIPCSGDQLSRVRLAGAKDLRAGCHDAKDRTDHVYPVKCC